ncbi:hypothetical protein SAMN07250955_106270 [Arboricoccus pini]|uniref:Uncharacterized protein n=1 Tax=Arboricoccus pini TaxID=1963835 RepID=A0A212R9V1_9PROT|nr:hypothetical protein [Arboricoccus pini]SNB68977.1 hypothetical protein SAMN07250955_106270 [Arboricoccus pini]
MASFNLHPIEPGWPRRWIVEAVRLIFESPIPTTVAALGFLVVPLLAFVPAALIGVPRLMLALTTLAMAPLYALVVLCFSAWLAGRGRSVPFARVGRLFLQELIPALAKGALLAALLVDGHTNGARDGQPTGALEVVGSLAVIVSLNALPSMWLEPFVRHLALETGAPLWRPTALLTLFSALRRVVPLPAMLALQLAPTLPFLLVVDSRFSLLRLAALPLLLLVQATGWIAYREVFHGPKSSVRRRAFAFAHEAG